MFDVPRITYGSTPGFVAKAAKGSGAAERKARNPAPEKPKPERKGVSPRLRALILERDKFCCVLCGSVGTKENPLHIGHVVPHAQGGTYDESNLRVECQTCNLGGGARKRLTPIDNKKIVEQLARLVGKKGRKA